MVAGSAVNLTVSKGPELVAVPDVTGKTESEARSVIANAGLTVGTVTQAYSASVPSGKVIRQTPAANSEAALGTAVNLVVSKGPEPEPEPETSGCFGGTVGKGLSAPPPSRATGDKLLLLAAAAVLAVTGIPRRVKAKAAR